MQIVGVVLVVLLVGGLRRQDAAFEEAPAAIAVPAPVHHNAVRRVASRARHDHHAAPQVHVDPTLPAALRLALLHHGVVVAVLYVRHAPGDDAAVKAAREGARGAHVGFAALDVSNDAVATSIALKLPGSSDPSVAVVRRPGDITLLLNGYVDSEVIAQAARDAGA